MSEEVIDVEEVGTELEVRARHDVTLFRTDDPAEIVQKATDVARVLAKVLKDQRLTANIKGREHVLVEGWTLCGTMLGVFPVCEWTRPVEGGWEARVEARTRDGSVVGAAEAECLRSEATWKTRDDYALRSMAQTRATSKALRLPLGFIVSLAGFEATPAEEMPPDSSEAQRAMERAQAAAPSEGPGATRIHFGKNGPKPEHPQGLRLDELTDRQLSWYAGEWEPGESDADQRLKTAAIQVQVERLPFS